MHPDSKAAASLELGLLLLLGTLWGIPYALTKIALATIPPVTLTAARVSIAAGVLWLVAWLLGRKLPQRWDFVGHVSIQGGILCCAYTLIALGQQSVDSALAAILNSTTPIFVCLIGVTWTRHEPMTFGRITGAMVGLGGVIVIAGASALSGLGRETAGQSAILLATFLSAVATIHGRRFVDVAPEIAAAGMLTGAAIVLVPACLLMEAPWRAAPSAASLAALGANAVIATALGFAIYFRLIRTLGSMGTASAGYLKPAVGVLIGCALLEEPFTWTLVIGLIAVLVGVVVINGSASALLLLGVIRGDRIRAGRREQPGSLSLAEKTPPSS